VKLYSPFAKKIPLNPPFSKGEFNPREPFSPFEKEGPGEIWTSVSQDIYFTYRGIFIIIEITLDDESSERRGEELVTSNTLYAFLFLTSPTAPAPNSIC
jgi:hypothetical protein